MSTPSRSAARSASSSGRTLKPMMIASEAEASITSDSLMPPVCEWMMLIATRSCGTFAISSWSASSEPATSALRTMLSSLISPSWARAKTSSRLTLRRLAAGQRLGLEPVRALLGELAGAGGRSRPPARTRRRRRRRRSRAPRPASPGRPPRRGSPVKSCIARTRPHWGPATSESPTRRVPRWTRTVTTGPRPGSSWDSITVPGGRRVRVGLRAPRAR